MLSLQQLVAKELAEPVKPEITEFAAYIAAQYPGAAQAVLFYGSCLRSEKLDGEMLDFYLIVSDYDAAYAKPWMVKWNKRLPPNVFPFQYNNLIAKVAVLSTNDFHKLNRPAASAVSVWARFSQPSRLAWSKGEDISKKITLAISGAAPTLLNAALSHMEREVDVIDLWQSGFAMTYSAELRAERKDRPASVIEHDRERYELFGNAALHHTMIPNEIRGERVYLLADPEKRAQKERARWPALRRHGKMLTIARLAKAAFTYTNGIDYLAWKINRHAGTQIEIKDWQRKWPLVAALFLVPRLLAKGAVR